MVTFQSITKSKRLKKKYLFLVVGTLLSLILITYIQASQNEKFEELFHMKNHLEHIFLPETGREKYLIDTPKCKIFRTEILNSEIAEVFRPQRYYSCSGGRPLLTYIKEDEKTVTLKVNQSVTHLYSYMKIKCCYSVITRDYTFAKPDDSIRISKCQPFEMSAQITEPFIRVLCQSLVGFEVYKHVHAIVSPKFFQTGKPLTDLNPETTFSVLLVGIDSISKTHIQRAMPRTYKFLETNSNFVNLRGFVKIGLNTLPNLFGMLAGLNLEQYHACPYVNHIDECDNIWKIFRKRGYVTAYAEDEPSISSFNYQKKGFHSPPTDLYFRPYMLAAEDVRVLRRQGMNFCAGLETEGERIMNLARDYQVAFKDKPKFGLFLMNSFSHDDFSMPSAMDEKVEIFLEEITRHLDRTIFFFFSDHGIRFGKARQTTTGWLEERMPFSYLYIPESFKKKFQKEYQNLVTNSRRLTNPYDMYMTLQDVLVFADRTHQIRKSRGCPLCHSLFREISKERTCEDAGIRREWCICEASSRINLTRSLKDELGNVVMKTINFIVRRYNQSSQCSVYKLAKVKSAKMAVSGHVIVMVETAPGGVFEGAFFAENSNSPLQLIAQPDRVDSYKNHSKCIQDEHLKRYCYCKN